MTLPSCVTWCPALAQSVIREARLTGETEAAVRHRAGLTATATDEAGVLADLLDRMPPTDDPRGWLDAELHRLRNRNRTTGDPNGHD